MYIKLAIREFLSADEIDILDVHGDLLQGLASGEITPSTENQERFVSEVKCGLTNAVGRSSKAWLKYDKLNLILDELVELRRAVELKEKETENLKKELAGMKIYVEILQLDLTHPKKFEWNYFALNRISEDMRFMLEKFEHAFVLKEAGVVSKEKFEELTAASGLWKAIRVYEKNIYIPSDYKGSTDIPRARMEICDSCGGAIFDGHCRCSN